MPALENSSSASKIFCRGLDIRVTKVMEAYFPQAVLFQQVAKVIGHIVRAEQILALRKAFWKLTYKEQDIISRHLGFYKVCFRPLPPNTFEELADLYQYSTADGVMRFYHRALKKLRDLLEREG